MFNVRAKPSKRTTIKAVEEQTVAPNLPLPSENPLEVQGRDGTYTGDIEKDDKAEQGAMLNLLKTLDKEATRQMGNGYWTALVFPDEDTCHEFMTKMGWWEISDGRGAYVDGLAVAERLGIELNPQPIRYKSRRSDKRLVEAVGVYERPEKKVAERKPRGVKAGRKTKKGK